MVEPLLLGVWRENERTIHGTGALMGLAKVFNEENYKRAFSDASHAITYEIAQFTEGGSKVVDPVRVMTGIGKSCSTKLDHHWF